MTPRLAAAACAVLSIWTLTVPVAACGPRGHEQAWYNELSTRWKSQSRHPLVATAYSARVPFEAGFPGVTSCGPASDLAGVMLHIATHHTNEPYLFGEVHDNPQHHLVRSRLYHRARVFEHIRTDQQPALDLFSEMSCNGQHIGSAGNLMRFLKWDASGWPDKAMFEPLFRSAINHRISILPGDPPRDRVRAVARAGLNALPAEEVRHLRLDEPLPMPLQEALLGELEASHCGLLPKAHFAGMALAQRYRDAHLAEALLRAAARHGSAILLAGNGHVRLDRGVPYYLRRLAPGRKHVSIQLLEVEEGKINAEDYLPRDPEGRPAIDYVIFTPRIDRPDPCIEMRKRVGK